MFLDETRSAKNSALGKACGGGGCTKMEITKGFILLTLSLSFVVPRAMWHHSERKIQYMGRHKSRFKCAIPYFSVGQLHERLNIVQTIGLLLDIGVYVCTWRGLRKRWTGWFLSCVF